MSSLSPLRCLSCGTDLAHDATRCRDCGAWAPETARGSVLTAEDLAEVETVAEPVSSVRYAVTTATDSGARPTPSLAIQSDAELSDGGASGSTLPRAGQMPAPYTQRPRFSPDETQPISRIYAQQAAETRGKRLMLLVGILVGVVIAGTAAVIALPLLRPVETGHLQPPRLSPPAVHVIAPAPPVDDPAPAVQTSPEIAAPKTETPTPSRPAVNRKRVSAPPARPVESPKTPPAPEINVRAGDLVSLGDSGVVPPTLLADVEPRLPARARLRRATGSVELSLLIDHQGAVEEVRTVDSSGNAQIDSSATTAAKASRFKPATRNGVPVRIWISRRYNFRSASR